jgi:integrase/recombinase XerD
MLNEITQANQRESRPKRESGLSRTKVEHASSGFYSVAQAAEMIGVHRLTVSRWCKSGKLPAFRVDFGNKSTYKIPVSLFLSLAQTLPANTKDYQSKPPKVNPQATKGLSDNAKAPDYTKELSQWVAAMANGSFNGKVYSPLTIDYYESNVRGFLTTYPEITRQNIQKCFLSIPVEAYAKRFKLYKALVSFCKWLIQQETLSEDVLEKLQTLQPKRHKPPVQRSLSEQDALKLLGVLRTPEEKAFVGIMLGAGLRVSELVALTWADIDLIAMAIKVQKGKGGKARVVGITLQLWQMLKDYQNEVSPVSLKEHLFKDPHGVALSRIAIGKRLERIGQRVGLKVSPHMLRRSFVTHNANKGRPLQMIQMACGHSDIKTTMAYCKTKEEEVVNAMKDW